MTPLDTPEDTNVEHVDKEALFIQIALKNRLVTEADIAEAREIQRKIEELGIKAKPLGDVLLERGKLEKDAFDRVSSHLAKIALADRIKGYKLLKRLGKGSMGTVYKAQQLSLDRVVAVKILAPHLQKNTKFVSRFIKEAKVLARLNHPNIVQCIDVGCSEGLYYLAMEYCDGPTVLDLIRRGGRMDEERATRIILQVSCALEHAYEHHVLHRDIKPDNIMIVANGVAKLCDLGLVKDLQAGGESTDTGATLGTANYISPEQARGDEDIDVRSDIYSLGAAFYHMVTGATPFSNPNPAVVMVSHINDMPLTPIERCPHLRSDTSSVIMKMLRKNRADRQQTPHELSADLEDLLGHLETGTRAPAGAKKKRWLVRRFRL
jgi:eukaryotic-like serine/threonine-protein kinase